MQGGAFFQNGGNTQEHHVGSTAGRPLTGTCAGVWADGLQGSPRSVFECSRHFGKMPPLHQLARGNRRKLELGSYPEISGDRKRSIYADLDAFSELRRCLCCLGSP